MKKSTLALALCFTLGSSFANAAGGGGGGGGGSAGGARSRKFCWRFTGLIDRRNVVDGIGHDRETIRGMAARFARARPPAAGRAECHEFIQRKQNIGSASQVSSRS